MTPVYARVLQALVRPFPNFDFFFIRPLRARAIALMRIRPGSKVLDVGCGSGGSFPYLIRAVGVTGHVVGVEISSSTAALAARRIQANRWSNVRVLVSPAQSVSLVDRYDALLMFAAPDVFASAGALDNLLPKLANNARVVFFGAKTSSRPFGWLLNRAIHLALTRLSLPTTPGLEPDPWHHIAPRLRDLEVEELFNGWMFLASGTLR